MLDCSSCEMVELDDAMDQKSKVDLDRFLGVIVR